MKANTPRTLLSTNRTKVRNVNSMMEKIMWDKVAPKNLFIALLVKQYHLLQKSPVYCCRTALCPSEQPSSFHPPLHTARAPSTRACVCSGKDFQRMMGLTVI